MKTFILVWIAVQLCLSGWLYYDTTKGLQDGSICKQLASGVKAEMPSKFVFMAAPIVIMGVFNLAMIVDKSCEENKK